MKPFYCTEFVIAPLNSFCLVRERQEYSRILKINVSRDVPACHALFI